MRRLLVLLVVLVAPLTLATPALASGAIHVWPGHSIQRAIDSAHAGQTIVVHRGTYHETLTVNKSGLTLESRGAVLRPPAHPRGLCATQFQEPAGICVVGKLDPATGDVVTRTRHSTIRGFKVLGFHSDGIILFGVADTIIQGNEVGWSEAYGIVGFNQIGGAYLGNVSHNNAEPGFYLGDSPQAGYRLMNNRSYNNHSWGFFIRDSAHAVASNNQAWGNCVGILVLDTPEPTTAAWVRVANNRVWGNNRACKGDPDEGEPPLSGLGIVVAGGRHITVTANHVLNNHPTGQSLFAGGIAMVSSKEPTGGSNPAWNTISFNVAQGNGPYDIFWDRTGSMNHFPGNACDRSSPAWICRNGAVG